VLTSAPNSSSSRASSGGTVPPAAMLMQVIRGGGVVCPLSAHGCWQTARAAAIESTITAAAQQQQ
jgi:hypothetical protein